MNAVVIKDHKEYRWIERPGGELQSRASFGEPTVFRFCFDQERNCTPWLTFEECLDRGYIRATGYEVGQVKLKRHIESGTLGVAFNGVEELVSPARGIGFWFLGAHFQIDNPKSGA